MRLRFLINLLFGFLISTSFLAFISLMYLIGIKYLVEPESQWIHAAVAAIWMYNPMIWLISTGAVTFTFYGRIDRFSQKILSKLADSYNKE